MNRTIRLFLALAVAAAILWWQTPTPPPEPSAGTPDAPATGVDSGAARIAEAFANQESGVLVETSGTIDRILPDDNEGDRHQRFIVRLSSGSTVLVAHNIDLAERVENLEKGDPISLRGQYEWNDRGGVVHWTHHDPQGKHPGGWIEHDGKRVE
ncbi:MAG: DUF3465 domain-containing protein [bacterium]